MNRQQSNLYVVSIWKLRSLKYWSCITESFFTLIELLVVIAIIGILVAVALPEFASMTEDAKKTKAKQDCDTIVQSVQKYNSLEGSMVEGLMDLKGKYLTNIDTLRDPWGNPYIYRSPGEEGRDYEIISLGADGKEGGTGVNADIKSWELH